jgi:hypothetical protein
MAPLKERNKVVSATANESQIHNPDENLHKFTLQKKSRSFTQYDKFEPIVNSKTEPQTFVVPW